MSGLELGLLAALTAGYIDAKHLLKEDITTILRAGKLRAYLRYNKWKGTLDIISIFESHAKKNPNKVALIYPRLVKALPKSNPKSKETPLDDLFQVEKYTWAQMFDVVYRYARVLSTEYGIEPGEAVAMDCTNNPDFVFLWLGLWCIGAVPVFINYNLADKSLLHCINISNSRYIFTDMEIAENVLAVQSDIKQMDKTIVLMDGKFQNAIIRAQPLNNFPQQKRLKNRELWSPAMYIYTSGTTGMPKSAILSWEKAIFGSGIYGIAMRLTSKDTFYSPMPLYHSTASILGLLCAFMHGGTFGVGHKFSTTTYWTEAKLCGATYSQYVGEVCRYLLNSPEGPDDKTHGVRVMAGNGMRADIWRQFKDRFNLPVIGEFYGATEMPRALTNYQSGDTGVGAIASYGNILKHILFKLWYAIAEVDKEDPNTLYRDPVTNFGRRVGKNQSGELLFRVADPKKVETSFQGYSNDKEGGDKKIVRDLFQKGDAWIRSGDLVRLDDESRAYFVDRMGDTFRWKSENVATNEVESAFAGIRGIQQVVVVGVQVPNHEGRAGFAVIVPTDPEKLPDLKLISAQLRERLPKYAVPIFLKFTTVAIENTGTMKVQKAKLRNQKIPGENGETIYMLNGDTYKPVSQKDWDRVTAGKARL